MRVAIDANSVLLTNGHFMLIVGQFPRIDEGRRCLTSEQLKELVAGKKGSEEIDLFAAGDALTGGFPTVKGLQVFDPDSVSHTASVRPVMFQTKYMAFVAQVAKAFDSDISVQSGGQLEPVLFRSARLPHRDGLDWTVLIMPMRP